MSKSREQLNLYLSEIDIEGKTVLDIGVQDKPTSRLTRGKALIYKTLDVDKKWGADFAADLNDDWGKWVMDTWDEETGEEGRKYDIIFCIETLEHCWNPIQALQNMNGLLVEGGDIYISTPFINPHHDIWDYLRFTGEWYEKVMPLCGFEDIEVKERVASVGRSHLIEFFTLEHMRVSKVRPEYGHYTYPIGYFIHAKKIKELT